MACAKFKIKVKLYLKQITLGCNFNVFQSKYFECIIKYGENMTCFKYKYLYVRFFVVFFIVVTLVQQLKHLYIYTREVQKVLGLDKKTSSKPPRRIIIYIIFQ